MGKATQVVKTTKVTKTTAKVNKNNSPAKHATHDCCVHKYHRG